MEYLYNYGLDNEDLLVLKESYNDSLLNEIIVNKRNVENVIEVLKNEKINIVYDLICNYLELFLLNPNYVENQIKKQKEKYKEKFYDVINEDISILGDINGI